MKQIIMLLLCCLLFVGCAAQQPHTPPQETEEKPVPTESTQPSETLPEPTESETEAAASFTVYTPNENLDGFFTTEVQGDQLTPLDALIAAGVLNEDIQVLSVTRQEETITVDFNSAFADLIRSMGTTGEAMIMGSVVNTFLSANNATSMMITVEGQILESGHAIYDFPMEMIE